MLALKDVSVHYDDGAPAVSDIALSVQAGERVALVGPSGAGKSTILGVSNGLVHPTRGQATAFGIDTIELQQRRHRHVRRRIGAVHQDFALVGSLRVANNVGAGRLGRWSTARALRSLIRLTDREGVVTVLEQVGISEKLWDRTDTLSGGQQQRVAIARMLYQQPDLLLADEPVSSLDPARSKAVLDVLVETCEADPTRALLASLHDAPLARSHFTRLVGLDQGTVVFDRPVADVSDDMLDELYAIEITDAR